MPEIGRPISPQEQQYKAVSIAPKALTSKGQSEEKIREQIINNATGNKPKSMYKEGPHNQMGKDEFLKLLTFQLQNQDPMNPMDQGKMTGELAQFSQLEQLSNLNAKFDQQNKNQMIQDKFFAASFVGKKVITSGSSLKVTEEGGQADVLFKLNGEAAKVVIRIMDEKNQTVGEIWKDGMSGGSHTVTWNGTTLDNQPAAKGNYKAVVRAWDQNMNEVPTQTQATGLVQSVAFEDGEPVLTVDGQKVFLRDVSSFHTGTDEMQNLPGAQQSQNGLRLQNTGVTPASPSPKQAINAYQGTEKGIYD